MSEDVVDAVEGSLVEFAEIGPMDLKGLSGPLRLFAARFRR